MKKIYRVTMNCDNSSANKTGYFGTEKDVQNIIAKYNDIQKKDKGEYYGNINFTVTEIYLGEKFFD